MRERGKGWGRPGSHPRATSGEGPSSGIPEYDPVIRFMTWPSPFGHPQLAPATPASGGLGRESPSYTGKSRHRRQEQSPASAWTHPVPIPPSPSSPKISSPQCTTEMPKGRRPSSGGGGSVSTQAGAVQTPETGGWLQSCPTTGWATWSHPAPGVRAEKGIVCAPNGAPGNHPTLDGGFSGSLGTQPGEL